MCLNKYLGFRELSAKYHLQYIETKSEGGEREFACTHFSKILPPFKHLFYKDWLVEERNQCNLALRIISDFHQ